MTEAQVDQDPARLRGRLRGLALMASGPAVMLACLHLNAMLDLWRSDWLGLAVGALIFGALSSTVMESVRARRLQPVVAYLEARHAGKPPSRVCREAFSAALLLPSESARFTILTWSCAAPVIVLGALMSGQGSWGFDVTLGALFLASMVGGLVATGLTFFLSKRALADVRLVLTRDLPDPVERAECATSLPLARKMQMVIVGTVIGVCALAIPLSYSQSRTAVDNAALDWQERVLDVLERQVMHRDVDEATAGLLPESELLAYPSSFDAARTNELSNLGLSTTHLQLLEASIESGARFGRMVGREGAGPVAWRSLGNDRILISRIHEPVVDGYFGRHFIHLFVVALIATGLGLMIAQLFSHDFSLAVGALHAEAERMARGDLRRGDVWEAEDEMGDLGRAFERMGGALRATGGRVAEAADRVDTAASEISSVSQSVAIASADQVRRIQQASELMLQINQQVAGVSESAQALNVSVEESSSSILELGAAGDELNDTASVLTSKVEEVSGSVEQMVRSVKEVGTTSEGLADAAAETSSSMEEMASAMRAVETTAETTADLSRDVVSRALSGQEKVTQTIEGMHAIRDAIDAAEEVIRGLGRRGEEIGGILDVIDDVADETNLLALNAAIIAAQAGEHGRAFSVVADEIKELADRVIASTKEIGGLIKSVQDESNKAVGAIETGSRSVAEGVELSAEAGTSLEEITNASRESGERITHIVNSLREQTAATVHVVGLMEGVRDGVAKISSASEEQDRGNEVVFRSVITMREVAQQVHRTTDEQARGFGRIRESVEGVREAVESINASLQDQATACTQVSSFLEQVFDGTRSNEEAAQRMGEAMRSLASQAEALRGDVARFQI